MYLSNSLNMTSKADPISLSLTFSSIRDWAFSRDGTEVPFYLSLICAPVSGLTIRPTVSRKTYSKRSITSLLSFLSFSWETISYLRGLPQERFNLWSLFPSPWWSTLNRSRWYKDRWSRAKYFHLSELRIILISSSSFESLNFETIPFNIEKKFSLASSSKWWPQPLRSSR